MNQRTAYKTRMLAARRIKALENLGVVWISHHSWQEMLEALKVICRENGGDPNVPRSHPTHGVWLNNQRSAYKAGKLAAERVRALEELGVRWEIRPRRTAD